MATPRIQAHLRHPAPHHSGVHGLPPAPPPVPARRCHRALRNERQATVRRHGCHHDVRPCHLDRRGRARRPRRVYPPAAELMSAAGVPALCETLPQYNLLRSARRRVQAGWLRKCRRERDEGMADGDVAGSVILDVAVARAASAGGLDLATYRRQQLDPRRGAATAMRRWRHDREQPARAVRRERRRLARRHRPLLPPQRRPSAGGSRRGTWA